MTKLTDDQRALLAAALETAEGAITVEAPRQAGLTALVKAGMMIIIPAKDGPDRALVTTAGRSAATPPQPDDAEGSASEAPLEPHSGPPEAAAAIGEAKPPTKLGTLLGLLQRPDGATIADMTTATGWQAHSVRGAIAGTLKKKLGHSIVSAKADGVRTYKLEAEAAG